MPVDVMLQRANESQVTSTEPGRKDDPALRVDDVEAARAPVSCVDLSRVWKREGGVR